MTCVRLSRNRYTPGPSGTARSLRTWCLGGLVAIITGHVARSQIKRTGEAGEGLALAGLIAGYVSIGLFFLVVLAYIAFFVFIFVFAATHPGAFPSPSPTPGPLGQ